MAASPTLSFALAIAVLLSATPVAAASGGGGAGEGIGTVVTLVFMVAIAYLATHYIVGRLQRRFLIVSGFEYLLLGALLGPAVTAIHAFDDMTGLLPVIALAAGWVGLLRGTNFQFAGFRLSHPQTWRVVLTHHLVPGLLVFVGAHTAMTSGLLGALASSDQGMNAIAIAAAVLGCCAAADSTEPLYLLGRRYEIGERVAPLLRQATRLGDIVVIFVFGIVLCWFRPTSIDDLLSLSAAEWSLVMVFIGALLGLLFRPFVAGGESEHARFLALVGTIAFASGAAYFLQLSSLTVNLVLGMVLVNVAREGNLLHASLESTEKPMAIMLLIFAGALWAPTPLVPTLIGIAGFVGLRLTGKFLASLITGWGTNLRRDLYRGLLAHGDVTVAMAVSFRLVYSGPAIDLAYAVVLGSVVLHDLVAPRLLRGLLVDEGDVQRELADNMVGATG